MLTSKQCDLLLKIIDDQPIRGRDMAAEIVAIGKEIEAIKEIAEKTDK